MLKPCVVQSVLLPKCFSWFICMQMWDLPVFQLPPHPLSPVATDFLCILSAPAACIRPPTSLNECSDLGVGLPYSLIFWQVWLFFVFKFVVLLLVVKGSKLYLPMPPSWPEVKKTILHINTDILKVKWWSDLQLWWHEEINKSRYKTGQKNSEPPPHISGSGSEQKAGKKKIRSVYSFLLLLILTWGYVYQL